MGAFRLRFIDVMGNRIISDGGTFMLKGEYR